MTTSSGATNIAYHKHSWGTSAQLAPIVGISRHFGFFVPPSIAAFFLMLVAAPLLWHAMSIVLGDDDQATVALLFLFLASFLKVEKNLWKLRSGRSSNRPLSPSYCSACCRWA